MEGVEDDKESCEINSINKKNKGIIVFLKKMWILHKDVLADETMQNSAMLIKINLLNHGGLALISPRLHLKKECDQEMNESVIYQRCDSSFVTARDKSCQIRSWWRCLTIHMKKEAL